MFLQFGFTRNYRRAAVFTPASYVGEYKEAIERLIQIYFGLYEQYTGHTHCMYTGKNWSKVFNKLGSILKDWHRLDVPPGLPDTLIDVTEDNIILIMHKYFEDGLHKKSDGRILHFLSDRVLAIRFVKYCY
jgi:hypothetical protein